MAPLNYSNAVRRLCEDIVRRLEVFASVKMSRVGVSFNWTRVDGHYGVWASMTPLRFENGVTEKSRCGIRWRMPDVKIEGFNAPLLYVLSIYVPRFFDLSISDKIETIIHELYHISPSFNGDVRRFPGHRYAHGSKKKYEARIRMLAKQWLSTDPAPELWDFLKYDSHQLKEHYGKVVGMRISIPKPVPISTMGDNK